MPDVYERKDLQGCVGWKVCIPVASSLHFPVGSSADCDSLFQNCLLNEGRVSQHTAQKQTSN